MKSIISCFKSAAVFVVMLAGTLFAQNTTFEIYPDETSITPLTQLELSDGGHTVNDDVIYVAAKVYLDIQPDPAGSWYLLLYTCNTVYDYDFYMSGPAHECNHLYADDGSSASLIWKYRNELLYGRESGQIGAVIPSIEWSGSDLNYLYMWNCVHCSAEDIDEDAFEWASIVHHQNSAQLPAGRLELSFGVDLSSSWRAAEYGSYLAFEVYYKE